MNALLDRLRATLRHVLPAGPAGRVPRPPRTVLRTGAAVPAPVLRLVLLAVTLAAGAVVADGSSQWWVVVAVACVIAVRPHAALLALGVAVLIGMLALTEGYTWQLPALVLLTHTVLRLGAVADAVAWRGRVEVAVLRDAAPAFLGVQLAGQAAALLALVLDGAAPVPWLAVGAVTALAVLGWAVVRDLRP